MVVDLAWLVALAIHLCVRVQQGQGLPLAGASSHEDSQDRLVAARGCPTQDQDMGSASVPGTRHLAGAQAKTRACVWARLSRTYGQEGQGCGQLETALQLLCCACADSLRA